MEDILSILYTAAMDLPRTEKLSAAVQEADPMHERLCQIAGIEEADRIWLEAMGLGTAESEDCFRRGFAMGFQLREELGELTR